MTHTDWIAHVTRTDKPWGHEELFALEPGKYCGKTLHVSKGQALSLQYHEHKEETIAVQVGRVLLEVGLSAETMESCELVPGDAVHLAPGTRHRITALVDSVILEASTTELDDVVRLDDRYGRTTSSGAQVGGP